MTPPRKTDDDKISVSFTWRGFVKVLPWILVILSGGGLAGMTGGLWGSPRSSQNSQAITTIQVNEKNRAKEIRELKDAMIRVGLTVDHIKETVNEIKRNMRDDHRHAAKK